MASRGRLAWLIGAGLLAAGAAAFAVVAFLSLSSARTERDEAAAALASVEARVDDAIVERAGASNGRTAAEADLDAAEGAITDAEWAVSESEHREFLLGVEEQKAGVEEAELREAAAGYAAAADALVAAIGDHLDTAAEMSDLRVQQAEAVAGGKYRTFNTLQDGYDALVGTFNDQNGVVAAAAAALPSFEYGDLASAGPPPAAVAVEGLEAVLDPPTGPAKIVGSLPDTIPCTPRSDGCRWYWEVTFTETNALRVTITRLGYRYIDTRGSIWILESGEWRDVTIVVPALGTKTWDTWVQSLDPTQRPNLQGGTVQVRWEGTDAEGNRITGVARARLERRED